MSTNYLNIEPKKISSGSAITWTKSLPQYPAPTFTLGYKLVGAGGIATATVESIGSEHTVTLTAAAAAGMYQLVGWATNSFGAKVLIYDSSIEVTANLIDATVPTDTRSFWQQLKDSVDAVMLNRATIIQKSMTVPGAGGRSIEFMDPGELYTLIKRCEYEIRRLEERDRIAQGRSRRQIKVQFV